MLHYTSSWCSTRFHILDSDSSPLRRNESNRLTLGLSPDWNALKNVSAFKLEFRTLKDLIEGKKVLYSFDSFHVAMHLKLKVVISVNYILNIIKSKILLPQS